MTTSQRLLHAVMAQNAPVCLEHSLYGDWARGYISEEYAQENRILLETLDRLTAEYSEAQLQTLEEIFVACSRYELAFWDMAWSEKE